MDSFQNIIKQYKDIALSDKEVLRLIDRKANLILYPNLHKYKTIDEVLEPYGACIILFAAQIQPSMYGHWCCIFKMDDQLLEFFNPYGGWPDDSLEYIPMKTRKKSHQYYPYLSNLMLDSPYELSYNEYKFQKHGENIKTCGRWCALRLICRYMPLQEFHDMVKYLTKSFNITNDELVTLLTMYINK
jgi:hypothetical protein